MRRPLNKHRLARPHLQPRPSRCHSNHKGGRARVICCCSHDNRGGRSPAYTLPHSAHLFAQCLLTDRGSSPSRLWQAPSSELLHTGPTHSCLLYPPLFGKSLYRDPSLLLRFSRFSTDLKNKNKTQRTWEFRTPDIVYFF